MPDEGTQSGVRDDEVRGEGPCTKAVSQVRRYWRIRVLGIPIVLLFLNSLNAPTFSIAYQAFFGQAANVRVFLQTIEVSVVATAICFIVGYPTAYLITAASKSVRTAVLVFVAIPYLRVPSDRDRAFRLITTGCTD